MYNALKALHFGMWLTALVSALPGWAGATPRLVNPDGTGDYPTIAAALMAAAPGDTIVLGDGVFTGDGTNLHLAISTSVIIRSESDDPMRCVIDGNGSTPGWNITVGAPGGRVTVRGITIRNARADSEPYGPYRAGAITAGTTVTIVHCRFENNAAEAEGGIGALCLEGGDHIEDCRFSGNSAGFLGMSAVIMRGTITRCTFYDNTVAEDGYLTVYGNPLHMTECTFVDNVAGIGYGAVAAYQPESTIDNTIIASTVGGTAVCTVNWGYAPIIRCCDFFENEGGDWTGLLSGMLGVNGNISVDPVFCLPSSEDFTLRADSPCAGGGPSGCEQIGAWPVGCEVANFTGTPLIGLAPLTVTFADHTVGGNGWEWDFQDDGVIDATSQNPVYTYTSAGSYSVFLRVLQNGEQYATGLKRDYVRALTGTNIVVMPTTMASSNPTAVPVGLYGPTPVGAISLYFHYDPAALTFQGVESYVPGEVFAYGIVGGRISVQWFDETGGQDPIRPGVDPADIFGLRFTPVHSGGTTAVTVDEGASVLADNNGIELTTTWVDDPPFGIVTLTVGAVVSGDVLYYWQNKAVPDAWLSMGLPNPDVSTNASGRYQFAPYPSGNYILTARKTTDLLGINALDAVKIVRHATGQEILNDPHKLQAADVNGSGSINALDAFKVVRVAVGIETIPGGDWRFDPPSWSFQPLNSDQERDFVAVRMGDVNGDWVVGRAAAGEGGGDVVAGETKKGEAGPTSSDQASGGPRLDRTLSLPDTTVVPSGPNVTVPLRVTGFDAIGAISLRIQFDPSVVHYVGLTSGISGVTFTVNLVGSELRIEWFDSTGGLAPITIGSGVLLRLEFDPVGSDGSSTALDFTSLCSIGDAEGDPIPDAVFHDGRIRLLDLTGVDGPATAVLKPELELFPTVGTGSGMLAVFRLVESDDVQVRIFGVDGRLVRVLVNRAVSGGVHQERWDGLTDRGTSAGAGLYFVRMSLRSGFVQTKRFVLVR
jgi:PKD repeat protein